MRQRVDWIPPQKSGRLDRLWRRTHLRQLGLRRFDGLGDLLPRRMALCLHSHALLPLPRKLARPHLDRLPLANQASILEGEYRI